MDPNLPTRVKWHTKIAKLERKQRLRRAHKTGFVNEDGTDEIATEYDDLGWAVLLEGSTEWLFIGGIRPNWEVGQLMEVTIEPATYLENRCA